MSFRVIHYINQFFGGIGGEELADHKPEVREGQAGPALALNNALQGEAEVVATIVCGDNYCVGNQKEVAAFSGPVQSACAQSLHKVLFHYFEEATAEPLHIDHLCVCRQPVHKTDGSDEKHTGFFSVLECFPLNGTMLYG